MSLVNDMLKDLDARRRGAPVKGNAAKKLTPASDRRGIVSQSRLPLVGATLGAAVIAVLVYWLLIGDRESSGELADLRSQQDESGIPGQGTGALSSVPDANDEVNNEAATIAALEARLAELEAANSAGAVLRNASDDDQAADWRPVDWNGGIEPTAQSTDGITASTNISASANTNINAAGQETVVPPPDSARADTQPLTQADTESQLLQPSAAQQRASTGSAIERQARQMPLVERDRLQVQEALTLWSQGQQLTALQRLDSFAYENPEAHQSRETLAKLLIRQGEVDRAMQAAELGLQIAPSHPGYKKIKARIFLGQSDVLDALTVLSVAPPSVSNDPEYHNLLATAQLAGGEYNEAIQSYRSLLRLNDARLDKAPLWYGLGSALQRMGNAAEARQAYQQALQLPELSASLRAQIERRMAAMVSAQ